MTETEITTSTGTIHARLAAILREVDAIGKERVNEIQRFKFRGVDDVYNALHGLFGRHGIYTRTEVLEVRQQDRQTAKGGTQIHAVVKIRYHLTASDGSSVAMDGVGEAADSGDKSIGKAMQYAYKVLLLQTFLIPTEEDKDPDASTTEWGRPAQQQRGGPPPKAAPPPAKSAPAQGSAEAAFEAIAMAKTPEQIAKILNSARSKEALGPSLKEIEDAAVKRSQDLLRREREAGEAA